MAAFCVTVFCSCILFENCFQDVDAPVLMGELLGLLGGTSLSECDASVGRYSVQSVVLLLRGTVCIFIVVLPLAAFCDCLL